jgi:hypothetical protein
MIQSNTSCSKRKTPIDRSTQDAVPGAAGDHFAGLQLFPDAHLVPQPVGSLESRPPAAVGFFFRGKFSPRNDKWNGKIQGKSSSGCEIHAFSWIFWGHHRTKWGTLQQAMFD